MPNTEREAKPQTFEELMQRIRAFGESRAILTAVELDVFTAIAGGATANEVAARIGANPRSTEMLLNALAACELLAKRDGVFSNTPLTQRFLAAGGPEDSRAAIMHSVHLWDTWSTLTDAVRTGTAVRHEDLAQRGDQWTEPFIAAMHRIASERAPHVVRALGAGNIRSMLDVGGGSGAYSIAFAQANPALKAEVLDLATVTPITHRHIAAAHVNGRVSTRVGDLRTDRLGQGYDLVFVSAICHMLNPGGNQDLLRRCFDATAPGGRTVIQDFILEPDKTRPKLAALFALNMLVGTPAGSSYSIDEYTTWLSAAGFKDIRRISLPGPSDLMVGVRS